MLKEILQKCVTELKIGTIRNMNFTIRCLLLSFFGCCVNYSFPDFAVAERPNIILMMGDDMGFSDLGCFGSEIETPNLDGLAQGGLRFTQFYNTARCCPTRASLLTGLYPHQAGVGWMMSDNGVDAYRGNLNDRCVTIAEALKPAGYSTYMAGKWHVTRHIDPDGPSFNWPRQRGFDRFYGTIHGAGSFFDPNTLMRENTMITPVADSEYKPDQFYYTDAISDHAVRYIKDHNSQKADEPFFIYVAYTAAHWPMHALPRDIAKYKGRYDAGYHAIRRARFERMKQMGLIPPSTELSPPAGDWSKVEHREWELRCMEVYAAMIDSMDQGVGRIVNALKETNNLENTLVFFLQDNGGCAEGYGRRAGSQWKTRPEKPPLKPMATSELQTRMQPLQTRDGFPVLTGPGVMPGPADTYIGYGKNWANVSNVPFREYKHWVHEGGISTPLIAHWPDQIRRAGELERQPGHLIDIMATCVDVAGADYPKKRNGNAIQPVEGRSLVPAFSGKQIARDEPIFFEHEGNRAVRDGKWKIVAKGVQGEWELYNIDQDRSEMHNLATAEPDRVKKMAAQWQAWAERADILPLTPYYNRKKKRTNKKRFNLKHGASLDQNSAPNIEKTGFSIKAQVKLDAPRGVIVAQGGDAHGFVLHFKDSKLSLTVNRNGNLSSFAHSGNFTAGRYSIQSSLSADGQVSIAVDDGKPETGKVAGPCVQMPIDGLNVGSDQGGTVGSYEDQNALTGNVLSLRLQLEKK